MFKKLFGKKTEAEPQSVQPLGGAIAEAIMSAVGLKGVPPMPPAAQRAFQLSTDPNAEARDFVEVIESDEALSARVLKIANSVYFDRGKPSQTIEESVLVIGINELRSLLSATTLSEIFPCSHRARQELWSHDIATALTARKLAERLAPAKCDLVFLGGLMHDLGKLLLLQRVTPDYLRVLDQVEHAGVSFCAAEADIFVFDHAEAGQLIGEKWKFSEELLDMIGNHHAHFEGPQTPCPLAQIVQAADHIAHALGLGASGKLAKLRSRLYEELPDVLSTLGFTDDQREFLQNVRRTFEVERDAYESKS
jgi:putative nucleotidyltransferase with HDIG domain